MNIWISEVLNSLKLTWIVYGLGDLSVIFTYYIYTYILRHWFMRVCKILQLYRKNTEVLNSFCCRQISWIQRTVKMLQLYSENRKFWINIFLTWTLSINPCVTIGFKTCLVVGVLFKEQVQQPRRYSTTACLGMPK